MKFSLTPLYKGENIRNPVWPISGLIEQDPLGQRGMWISFSTETEDPTGLTFFKEKQFLVFDSLSQGMRQEGSGGMRPSGASRRTRFRAVEKEGRTEYRAAAG